MRDRAAVLATLTLVCACRLQAQAPAPERRLLTIFSGASHHAQFRLHTTLGATGQGRLAAHDSVSLTLASGQSFRIADLDDVRQRQSEWLKGGLIGAIAGGVVGYLFIYQMSAHYGDTSPPDPGHDARIGATIGAPIGFCLGVLVGLARPVWRRLYP